MNKIPPNIKIKMRKADVGRSASRLKVQGSKDSVSNSGSTATKVPGTPCKACGFKAHFTGRIAHDSVSDHAFFRPNMNQVHSGNSGSTLPPPEAQTGNPGRRGLIFQRPET